VAGRFRAGEGHFEGDDSFDGRPIRVRYEWSEITPISARWEQSFSFEQGGSFAVNWTMSFRRAEA
jgi:hypothetical protein